MRGKVSAVRIYLRLGKFVQNMKERHGGVPLFFILALVLVKRVSLSQVEIEKTLTFL